VQTGSRRFKRSLPYAQSVSSTSPITPKRGLSHIYFEVTVQNAGPKNRGVSIGLTPSPQVARRQGPAGFSVGSLVYCGHSGHKAKYINVAKDFSEVPLQCYDLLDVKDTISKVSLA